MLTKNFKFLRHYFDYKQVTLSKMLDVPQSNISYYENGKKDIPINILQKLSSIYGITIEDLLSKDLSQEYDTPQIITLDDLETFGENIFLFLTSNIAKKNNTFNHAFDVWDSAMQFENIEDLPGRIAVLEHAITLFQKAWEESNIHVALANSISITLFIYAFYTQRGMDWGIELLNKKSISTIDIQKNFTSTSDKVKLENPYITQQKCFFEKYYDLIYDNIKQLKKNPQFSDIGDYYFALCFVIGFTEDYLDYESSVQTGIYMLIQLCKLNNTYAENFIESIPPIS